ncbi:hypothetical protein [Lentzea kentuckyensis]|uniref:restriction system modified-DNA reader domain-containing protein n=1 Tax=Lentzea kentuckyensis TaxID=360086 RepID=UPI00117B7868|nr:hypothetical protein [Lentzea kentuckyensis]
MSTSCDTVVKPQPSIDTFDVAAVRARESLPANAVVIIVDGHPVAQQPPSDVWGLRVIAADTAVESGRLALFAVVPLSAQPDPRVCDGDVVVRLHTDAVTSTDVSTSMNVGVWLAQGGSWALVGTWTGLGAGWPDLVAPTVIRLMQCDTSPVDELPTRTSLNGRFGALRDMVSAGLLHDGEKLLCARPGSGVRYDAHVIDGGIQLPDGRWYARPSGALTALGYRHQNGWTSWYRARDGVPLSEIRLTPPRARHRQQGKPQLHHMLADGTLHAGDELRFVQPRKGIVHTALVLADGQIQLQDGRLFPTPAAAIVACHPSVTDGWRTWRRVSDNRTLAELRDEHRNRAALPQAQPTSTPHRSDDAEQGLSSTPATP